MACWGQRNRIYLLGCRLGMEKKSLKDIRRADRVELISRDLIFEQMGRECFSQSRALGRLIWEYGRFREKLKAGRSVWKLL